MMTLSNISTRETNKKGGAEQCRNLIENVLTYDATVGKHHFNLVAGQTYEEENTDLRIGRAHV